jgi:entericidin B
MELFMSRICLVLVALLGLSACETVKGAGQDLQNAGQTIEGEAAQTQADM